jgi:PAS domain S-box-containing protein
MSAYVYQRHRFEEELLGLSCVLRSIVDEKTKNLQQTVDILHEEVLSRIAAERPLHEHEPSGQLQQFAGDLPDVLWLLDAANERVLYVSPVYEKIWGRSCQSLYADSRSWLDAVHPDDRDRALILFNLGTSVAIIEVEIRIRRADGVERWIHGRGYPVRDASGRLIRIAGIACDITEWKNLEAQFRRAHT